LGKLKNNFLPFFIVQHQQREILNLGAVFSEKSVDYL